MENLDWVNAKREYVRSGPRIEISKGQKVETYKQSVHTWIINSKGEFLMQKRSPSKKHFPNTWSQTGGGIKQGETSIEAVIRECKEELNVDVNPDQLELKLSIQREFDYVDIFVLCQDVKIDDVVIQEDEVTECCYFTRTEIEEMLQAGLLAPSVAAYFEMLIMTIDKNFDEEYVMRRKRTIELIQ